MNQLWEFCGEAEFNGKFMVLHKMTRNQKGRKSALNIQIKTLEKQ